MSPALAAWIERYVPNPAMAEELTAIVEADVAAAKVLYPEWYEAGLADGWKGGVEAERNRILAMDTPWPLLDVLERLAGAAEHLLKAHDCDAHGWESVAHARDAAQRIVATIRGGT